MAITSSDAAESEADSSTRESDWSTGVHLGEITGWASVALGQLVSWPQVLKLRRERGEGVSLASYAIVLVSMSLFLVHAIAIGDPSSKVSVPVSLIPNVVIAVTLARRRRAGTGPKALAPGAGSGSEVGMYPSQPVVASR